MSNHPSCPRHKFKPAFTLIELLIVVGIVAVLISILIPALSKVREQARRVMCMANQRTIGQAVHGFAAEHDGFGQAITGSSIRSEYAIDERRYVYEVWPSFISESAYRTGRKRLAPWPIAYADYLGAPGLRTETFFADYFPYANNRYLPLQDVPLEAIDQSLARKRQVKALQCPAQPHAFGRTPDTLFGRLSYKINQDVFELERHYGDDHRFSSVWRNGTHEAEPLSGRLERVVRPAEVLMFLDGGGRTDQFPVSLWFSSGAGPNLSDWAGDDTYFPPVRLIGSRLSFRLPRSRHSKDGGLVGVFVDGHAGYFKPVGWQTFEGIRAATKFAPNPRITPYEPGVPQTRRRGASR